MLVHGVYRDCHSSCQVQPLATLINPNRDKRLPVSTSTCVYLYLCLPLPVSTSTCVYLYLCLPLPVSTSTSVYLYLCLPLPLSTSTCVYLYLCLPLPVSTSTCVYLYLCLPLPVSTSTCVYPVCSTFVFAYIREAVAICQCSIYRTAVSC